MYVPIYLIPSWSDFELSYICHLILYHLKVTEYIGLDYRMAFPTLQYWLHGWQDIFRQSIWANCYVKYLHPVTDIVNADMTKYLFIYRQRIQRRTETFHSCINWN